MIKQVSHRRCRFGFISAARRRSRGLGQPRKKRENSRINRNDVHELKQKRRRKKKKKTSSSSPSRRNVIKNDFHSQSTLRGLCISRLSGSPRIATQRSDARARAMGNTDKFYVIRAYLRSARFVFIYGGVEWEWESRQRAELEITPVVPLIFQVALFSSIFFAASFHATESLPASGQCLRQF